GVIPRKRHALGHALVYDIHAQLGQAVNVRFAGTEVTALDRVVEQALDAVAVVRIVLGRVDTALGRDAVSTAWRVLEAEDLDVVSQLAEGRGGGSARKPGADNDDAVPAFVRRV